MKIRSGNGSGRLYTLLQTLSHHASVSAGGGVRPQGASQEEKNTISNPDFVMRSFRPLSDGRPDDRGKRVARIRELVRTGSYHVDLEAVSDRVLQALLLWRFAEKAGGIPLKGTWGDTPECSVRNRATCQKTGGSC
jgi:anti-sigma28 factor (negative regulator of flagellin synthesis)